MSDNNTENNKESLKDVQNDLLSFLNNKSVKGTENDDGKKEALSKKELLDQFYLLLKSKEGLVDDKVKEEMDEKQRAEMVHAVVNQFFKLLGNEEKEEFLKSLIAQQDSNKN